MEKKKNQHSHACSVSLCPTSTSTSRNPSKDSQLAKERLKISLKKKTKKYDFLQSEGNLFTFFTAVAYCKLSMCKLLQLGITVIAQCYTLLIAMNFG